MNVPLTLSSNPAYSPRSRHLASFSYPFFVYEASNAGKAIIINGAASSVGAFTVQLAKRAGLYVVATAGSSKDYPKELGADVVVDYREHKGDAIVSIPTSAAAYLSEADCR